MYASALAWSARASSPEHNILCEPLTGPLHVEVEVASPRRVAFELLGRLAASTAGDIEARIAAAVILMAVCDASATRTRSPSSGSTGTPSAAEREDALDFLGDWRFDAWALAAGFDPGRLRRALMRAGAWPVVGLGGPLRASEPPARPDNPRRAT